MRTNVYIDGFNLYYGSLKAYPQFKWLDVAEMCRRLLPGHTINRIRYFTARVDALPHDPQAPDRQDIYLRALETIPDLTIHFGRFATRPTQMPTIPLTYLPGQTRPRLATVLKTEEKRSDVNLATFLLVDCFDNDFDEAVIVSNDSDLVLPIEQVTTKFGKPVGVINPHPKGRISQELIKVTTFQIRTINKSVLSKSQFPKTLTDASGRFRRPRKWQ